MYFHIIMEFYMEFSKKTFRQSIQSVSARLVRVLKNIHCELEHNRWRKSVSKQDGEPYRKVL